MKPSTKHQIAQRVLALVAFLVFVGALKIWRIPFLETLPDWVGLVGLAAMFIAVLSALGFGPWGRTVTRLISAEDKAFRD